MMPSARGLIQNMLTGSDGKPTKLVMKRVKRNCFRVSIINASGEDLVLLHEGELLVGDTLALCDVHRAFDITVKA